VRSIRKPSLRSAAAGLLIALAGACGSTGTGAPDDGSTPGEGGSMPGNDGGVDRPEPVGNSPGGVAFIAQVILQPTDGGTGGAWGALPQTDRFSLFFTDEARPRLVASRDGTVGTSELTPSANGYRTQGAFAVGPGVGPDGPCMGFASFTYQRAELSWSSTRLAGTVSGHAEYVMGDVIYRHSFTGTIGGTPDREAPSGQLHSLTAYRRDVAHPMDGAVLELSEAVGPGGQAALVAPDGSTIPLEARRTGLYAASFFTGARLQPATSYRAMVMPAADLAGNAAGTWPTLTTQPVPLIPEDGFEGDAAPLLEGAQLVGADRAPPITGSRSLLFPPRQNTGGFNARFSARLALSPGDRLLRAKVRVVVDNPQWTQEEIFLGVHGASADPLWIRMPDATGASCEPAGASPCYTPAADLELPLPATSATEVLVDLNRRVACGFPPPPAPGYLIDDLRIE
jgi:hypothetical protein